ncbi:MAG: Hsp20 family protein [Pseudomonadota bacterium]
MARRGFRHQPVLLGFDDLERLMDGLASQSGGAGYPPYNLERIREESGGDVLRITLAVAGFALDELEIQLEGRELTICGRQADCGEPTYLHRGIAARPFRRAFTLGAGLEVHSADLENGLLSINLTMSETAPRRVRIGKRG